MMLGLIALGIGVESLLRLFQPIHVAFVEATWIAVLGLGVNVASVFLLSGGGHHHDHGHSHGHHGHDHHGHDHHGHDHHGHDHHGHGHHDDGHHDHGHQGGARDNNLRSAYIHVIADALTSVFAIVALLSGRILGWVWLDPVMGIIGGIVIGRWSWSLMRDTARVLLDRTDDHVAGEVRELVEAPGDARLADLHVWRIGPEAIAGIVSVVAHGAIDAEAIRARLKPVHEIVHLTVEMQDAS